MSEKNGGDNLLAFLLGGIIGGVVGVLLAPASGKETRKKVAVWLEDTREEMEDLAEKGKEKFAEQKERIESVIEAGKKVFDKNK